MPDTFHVTAIGHVITGRTEPIDDEWDSVAASIVLDERFDAEALMGIDAFSHVEVIYLFHQVPDTEVESKARHPRGNTQWPRVGIFAQRGKGRPNRIGATIARIERVDGRTLHLTGLDAIDGTPVLDLKPVMKGFLPRGDVREPDWAAQIMTSYW
ncbi:SAM-dependent methyltransferase [Pyruvatibacter sp.]|uniref:SAM-dependent methyltransferase n=1 Tax=Pyruvatibacter sp. TaxID=1981328 RepID=UPI0032EC07E0